MIMQRTVSDCAERLTFSPAENNPWKWGCHGGIYSADFCSLSISLEVSVKWYKLISMNSVLTEISIVRGQINVGMNMRFTTSEAKREAIHRNNLK